MRKSFIYYPQYPRELLALGLSTDGLVQAPFRIGRAHSGLRKRFHAYAGGQTRTNQTKSCASWTVRFPTKAPTARTTPGNRSLKS